MKTSDIQKAIGKMQVLKFHNPVIENIMPFYTYEYDVMSVSKSGMICEFEVKISRSDFLTIKEKTKCRNYSSKEIFQGRMNTNFTNKAMGRTILIPNYFSYCCPVDLIKLHEIPDFAGLYYVNELGQSIEMRSPKQIHKYVFDLSGTLKKILRYFSERHFLGNCRMTYENKQTYNPTT